MLAKVFFSWRTQELDAQLLRKQPCRPPFRPQLKEEPAWQRSCCHLVTVLSMGVGILILASEVTQLVVGCERQCALLLEYSLLAFAATNLSMGQMC